MFAHRAATLAGSRLIVNFPTKRHWRHPSRLSYVQAGLVSLRDVVVREDLASIAIPPLGCGNGGLDWVQVRPLIAATFCALPGVDVQLFEPTR
jgi:O-acetyl-ADP-ribose deacetylase (regulator of RNase III)